MSLLIVICLLILLPTEICLADEVLCARYPALSPDGGTVAFSYMGDIWTASSSGGTASRLTVHEGDDVRPHFSPDGNYVMFSSRRYNNYDVFVIPVSGGNAKQLTFHSAADFGSGWFPEGDSILFTSLRDGWRDIFKISIDGGMPIKLTGYPYEQDTMEGLPQTASISYTIPVPEIRGGGAEILSLPAMRTSTSRIDQRKILRRFG